MIRTSTVAAILVTTFLAVSAHAARHVPSRVQERIRERVVEAIGAAEDGGFHTAGACDQPAGFLSCSSNITGSLSTSDCYLSEASVYTDIYLMSDVTATSVVTAKVTSSTTYPILIAFHDEEGEIVQHQVQAKSASVTLHAGFDRDLFVSVTFVQANATGPYNLAISCTQQQPPSCVWSGTLACGGSFTGTVTQNECGAGEWPFDAYRINLQAGQTLRIHTVSQLPAEVWVEHNDDSMGTWVSGGSDQVVTFTATKAGQHDVYISTSDEDRRFTPFGYTLSVTCPAAAGCGKQRSVRH